MQASAFKKYDIRGIVGTELTIENTYRLTQAIVHYFKQQDPNVTTIIVGRDGRTHSPAIAQQVIKAVTDSGLDVYDIGTCPTPLFYFANQILSAPAGIMVTASHNPKEYNGLKLMQRKISVFDAAIQTIKDLYFSEQQFQTSTTRGTRHAIELTDTYVQLLVDQFAHLRNQPINAVIDCAHGATATVIPALVEAMNWTNVELLYATLDGTFPAHDADPTKECNNQALRANVKQHHEYIGIGFDGDGDRMAAMTEQGILLKGDEHGALFAQHIAHTQQKFTIICDIKCANALLNHYQTLDINCMLTPCGIGFVRAAMRTNHALFGGELSCHFCFADRYFGFDDGIYAMLRLLELRNQSDKTLQALYDALPARFCSPELRLECPHEHKQNVIAALRTTLEKRTDVHVNTIDGIRASTTYGCASVRPSNTEPLISARFEGTTQQNLDRIMAEFYTLLMPHFEEPYLKKMLKRD